VYWIVYAANSHKTMHESKKEFCVQALPAADIKVKTVREETSVEKILAFKVFDVA